MLTKPNSARSFWPISYFIMKVKCLAVFHLACMVPLYKGKGDVHECSNFRGISLLSVVGKVYGRILINRIRDKTENVIAEVQSVFRRGRRCTD